jgi:poly-gamma-glutamate synthesis protein (capsule biosynthesis protein)
MKERTIHALCSIYGWFLGDSAYYSHETEGNFASMRIADKLWWAYKRYIHQVEHAQKGKGIEELFARQNLHFGPPKGFVEECAVTFSAGGDLMSKPFLTRESTQHVWDEISNFYFDADIVYANLESPITFSDITYTLPQRKTTPSMNNSPEMLEVFHRGGKGITFFGTANNHCMDMGAEGLVGTLDLLDAHNYAHTGTARTEFERDDLLIIEKHGVRIAFLAYTFSLNGKNTPSNKPYMANYIRLNTSNVDLSRIQKQIEEAKLNRNADVVVLLPHWSLEYELYPTQTVMRTARRLAALGADAIIGNHPHCIQPIERLRALDPFTNCEKDCLVVYALGNLIDDAGRPGDWNLANLIKLRFSKGKQQGRQSTFITDLAVMPLYATAKREGGRYADHRLLSMRKLVNDLRAGRNPYGLDENEQNEVFRLEYMMLRVLGPAIMASNTSALLKDTADE